MILESARWTVGPSAPRLSETEIHVWQLHLDLDAGELEHALAELSEAERRKVTRLSTNRLRRRYLARRGGLRRLLAAYLEVEPQDLQFGLGDHDKPHLLGAPAASGLRFNTSHAGDRALVAVAEGREIGVDLERIRADVDFSGISQRFFAPSEAAAIAAAPEERRLALFFRYWASKEAWIKAVGRGLSMPLNRFVVEIQPGLAVSRVEWTDPEAEESPWFVHRLPCGADHAAALAVSDPAPRLRLWRWSPTVPGGSLV